MCDSFGKFGSCFAYNIALQIFFQTFDLYYIFYYLTLLSTDMTRGRGGGGGGGYNRRRGGGGGGRGRGGGSGFGQIIIGEELKIALSLSLKKFKVSSQ